MTWNCIWIKSEQNINKMALDYFNYRLSIIDPHGESFDQFNSQQMLLVSGYEIWNYFENWLEIHAFG